MPRIHVVSPEKIQPANLPQGCSGGGQAAQYVDPEKFPLQLTRMQLGPADSITVDGAETEWVGYVWQGAARAGGQDLSTGSSFIVEHGQQLAVDSAGEDCVILLFSSSHAPADPAPGGHVHLLPSGSVPRDNALTDTGVSGGMHADSQCDTCNVWLHENGFPGMEPVSAEEVKVGVHSHSEDEIIFIIEGEIRLGRKLFPAGTAIAIPGDTLYSFTAGPNGMRFVNFRAAMPTDIHFASGDTMSETEYWRKKLPRPEYLEPA